MIQELLDKKDVIAIREYVKATPLANIALDIEELEASDIIMFLRMLSTDDAAEIFAFFDKDVQWELLEKFTVSDHQKMIKTLQSDEIADLLDEMPANIAQKLLQVAPVAKRRLINQLLNYKDDQVGSIMAVDMAIISENNTCARALNKIKNEYEKNNAELVHYYFVIDSQKQLIGSVTLEDIVFSTPETKISEILFPVASLKTTDLTSEATVVFAEHDMSVLPVVNNENYLVGMVTADDIIDAINQAATDDIYKMAAIHDDDLEKPYLKKKVAQLVKSRIFWLIILLIGSTLSQVVIEQFTTISSNLLSGVISSAILVAMVPVISGAAGNAGSQSSTTITRAYALGEIEGKEYKSAIWKEFRVSLIVGSLLFIVNFARLLLYFSATKAIIHEPILYTFVSLSSSLAIFFVIIFAKILGTIIPIIAIKFKRDPAVLSAPLLSTLSDAISTLIFFGITIAILYAAHPLFG